MHSWFDHPTLKAWAPFVLLFTVAIGVREVVPNVENRIEWTGGSQPMENLL